MLKKKIWIVYILLILLITPVLAIPASSENGSIPSWNREWSYRQEIILPIKTDDSFSKFQPIDLHITFHNPCWAKNEYEHSIRICCWDGRRWHELESQIYDLESVDTYHISKCGIVFLVPEIANGDEQYFIYYDNDEKPSPNYVDHVKIEDAYYYYEPISGISLEGDYYKIEEDGFGIYAIGQKGKLITRALSQAVMTLKPGTKIFDVSNADNIASFCFGYNVGPKDEDQLCSDQILISKEVRIDGNLMIEFGIVSESNRGELRTTNVYRYYYCPIKNKRLFVHAKHQIFEEGIVTGQENVDGGYGGLLSFRSRSSTIKRMRFGEILPYLHIFGENNQIKEYKMNTNPENKEREWIVPYTDDCDLGEDAWISLDEGESGKAFGLIFSTNKNIVKYGKNERDGIQIQSNEKEYLNVLGTEMDYAAVVFGRNSYERGEDHDLTIPKDLLVEYDAEFFTSTEGGYKDVISEGEYFRTLIKYRQTIEDGSPDEDQNIYTLSVYPKLTSGVLSFPFFSNLTGIYISKVWAELYQNNQYISTGEVRKIFLGPTVIKFPKLAAGDYVIKIYRKIFNLEKKIIGLKAVSIKQDIFVKVICTWEKPIQIITKNQNGHRIKNIELSLLSNETILLRNLSSENEDTLMKVNYKFFEPYILKADYKGFTIYQKEIPRKSKKVEIIQDLYNLYIHVKDIFGFSPGVNVRPFITSSEMDNPIDLIPEDIGSGYYEINNLPPARYKLYISYGSFSDELYIDLPADGDSASIQFSAVFDLETKLFDSRGNPIQNEDLKLDIKRNGKTLFKSLSQDKVINIPPGKYTVNVYSDSKLVGSKTVELNTDKSINIVTKIESIIPTLVTVIVIVIIIEIFVLLFFKKFSLNTFLKILAMALIFISLFQPWWALYSQNKTITAEKSSEMFIIPQAMIEKVSYEGITYPELATLPEIFTDFVGILLFIIYSGIILIAFSFIPNILLKRRYFVVLISASVVFLILVALAFSFGISKITELTLGSLNGEGILATVMPNGETVNMHSTWGLGVGFYLCIFSALLLIATGVIDFLRKKKWPKVLFGRL